MTIEEIKKSIKKYTLFIYIYSIPGFFILYASINEDIKSKCSGVTNNFISESAMGISLLVLGLLLIFGAIYFSRYQNLVKCPYCQSYVTPNNSGTVIATKNCASCGEKVVSKFI